MSEVVRTMYGEKFFPEQRVALPAELTFASVYMRKKPAHLSKPRALANPVIVPPLHPHISFFFLTFLFSPKETRASAVELLADPYLNQEQQ